MLTSKSTPNVILILADDMGYGDLGILGDGSSQTPNLDNLAGEGLLLTQCYSSSPVCAPARASLLTGRYPHRTGAIEIRELRGLTRLCTDEITIADIFKEQGYSTGLVGKWHLGAFGKEYHPNARGFDEFVGFRGGQSDYYDYILYYNQITKNSNGSYLTDVITEESIKFIHRHSNEPFFLHIAYNAPHLPLQAPEADVKPFSNTGRFTKAVSTLYGMIFNMDRGIGHILDALKELKLDDNTIVLFSSDNGPFFGGTGEKCAKRYNAKMNGSKSLVYEGGIKVPTIIRWPGVLKAGEVNNSFIHFTDWLPTLCSAAGIKIPNHLKLDGINTMPFLLGNANNNQVKRFWQWNRYTPLMECNAAMRDGPWKLLRPPIPEAMLPLDKDIIEDRFYEQNPDLFLGYIKEPLPVPSLSKPLEPLLYNIWDDPSEKVDLASAHPERVKQMLKELENWFNSVESDRRRTLFSNKFS